MAGGWSINNRYELEPLPAACGGMGEVWFGRDVVLDREVAVKLVRTVRDRSESEFDRRFRREARIIARIAHPGVPAVYDVGMHEGRRYMVMERVHGITLADLVAEQEHLSVGWAAAIGAQVAAVLAVAHDASLVHRDLKPSNLMLQPDGAVRILDFGLAVGLDRTDFSQITVTGQHLGTPAYMAPEQIVTQMSTPATDLYALGCTLYHMLTGAPPFEGESAYHLMYMQVEEQPEPLRARRPDVPPELDDLVLRMLAKAQGDRPSGAEEVFERLLPFVTRLDDLPGVIDRVRSNVVHMYATAVSRCALPSRASGGTATDGPVTGRRSRSAVPLLDRSAVRRARVEAERLVRASRHGEAVQLLNATVVRAGGGLDPTDPEMISLRMDLAEVLFQAGDFRAAGPVYGDLAADVAAVDGPHSEQALRCRLKEATCRALTDQSGQALALMEDLLRDRERIAGTDDPSALELRRQIGLLYLGAGDRAVAETTLRALERDLVRLHGPAHSAVEAVRGLLAGFDEPGGRDA